MFKFLNIFVTIWMASSSSRSASPLELRAKVGDSSRAPNTETISIGLQAVAQPKQFTACHRRIYISAQPDVICFQAFSQSRGILAYVFFMLLWKLQFACFGYGEMANSLCLDLYIMCGMRSMNHTYRKTTVSFTVASLQAAPWQ